MTVDFEGGRLLNPGFARYRVPRINGAPRIEVALVGDAETPSTGAGEPGIVPIAPALANAVHQQTGVRMRELPIQRHLADARPVRASAGGRRTGGPLDTHLFVEAGREA